MDEDLKRLLDAIRQENAAAHADTRQHPDVAIETLRQENAAAHADTRQHTNVAIEALRQENAAAHADTRRYFDIALEAPKHEIQLVAEGLAMTREQLARTTAEFSERLERTAAEAQAMIKFSHAELDRRLRTLEDSHRALEETVTDLGARLERIESSTH